MTSRDGKDDPQDAPKPQPPIPLKVKTGHLFGEPDAGRAQLQQRIYTALQRTRSIEAQLAGITREKREELKKLKDTVASLLDQVEELG